MIRSIVPDWDTKNDRQKIQAAAGKARAALQKRFMLPESREAAKAAGLVMENPKPSIYLKNGRPALEVHSVRPARRNGPDFQAILDLVIEVTQRRRGYFDPGIQVRVDGGTLSPPPEPDFILRGGCTFLVDPVEGNVRYCIYKDIMSENRLNRMRDFLQNSFEGSLYATYFGNPYEEYYLQRTRKEMAGEPPVKLFSLLNLLHHEMEA